MKQKRIVLTGILLFTLILESLGQSGQIQGSATSTGNLYQEKFKLGVGSADEPKGKIHIFNGASLQTSPAQYQGERPFLITGEIRKIILSAPSPPPPPLYMPFPPTPTWGLPITHYFFTVNKMGNVGINILNPLTKLHLHSGVFTFTTGNENEPTSNWQIHGTQNAFAIRNATDNRYDFWINKSNGFVGIGTSSPQQKFHLSGSGLISHNFYVNNRLGIGTTSPQQKLDVRGNAVIEGDLIIKGSNNNTPGTTEIKLQSNGYIRAREIKVDLDAIPDYVFKKDYNLMPLPKLKEFIEKHQHLPNVKSEKEFIEEGSYGLGEMNVKLLEKVEELTLYILQLEERIKKIESKGGAK